MATTKPPLPAPWKWNPFLESPAPILLVWLFFYAGRPFFLGLYHDDWVLYFHSPSWSNTNSTFWLFANRPVLGIYHIVTSWLAQGSIPLLHVFAGLTVLVTALTLRKFLISAVSYAFGESRSAGSNIAVSLWLLMPWTLGSTAWIITNPTLLSVLGFSLAGLTLLKNWRYQGRLLPWLPLSILISALSYEIFIAQIPLLISLYYLKADRSSRVWPPNLARTVLIIIVSLFIALLTRLALERAGLLLGFAAPMKSFYQGWPSLFQRSFWPGWMAQALLSQEHTINLLGFLITGLVVLVLFRLIDRDGRRLRRIFLSTLIALAGYSLSCLIPALAGYALSGIGLGSRVTIGASFWLSFFLAFIFTAAGERKDWMTYLSWIVALVLACAFSAGMATHLSSWKAVWNSELGLLRKIDIPTHSKLGKDSLVVLNRPISRNGVYGFQASWDLAHAIKNLTGGKSGANYIVAGSYWKVYANEGKVVQRAGDVVLAEYVPSTAWVLDAESGSLRPMQKQEVLGGGDYP
jgi:hypothetical protein